MFASLKLEKLDRRHVGHETFKFRVWVEGSVTAGGRKFVELRNELWEAYGPSTERDLFGWTGSDGNRLNQHWAWYIDEAGSVQRFYIYLVGDEEASFFKLKWM